MVSTKLLFSFLILILFCFWFLLKGSFHLKPIVASSWELLCFHCWLPAWAEKFQLILNLEFLGIFLALLLSPIQLTAGAEKSHFSTEIIMYNPRWEKTVDIAICIEPIFFVTEEGFRNSSSWIIYWSSMIFWAHLLWQLFGCTNIQKLFSITQIRGDHRLKFGCFFEIFGNFIVFFS